MMMKNKMMKILNFKFEVLKLLTKMEIKIKLYQNIKRKQ